MRRTLKHELARLAHQLVTVFRTTDTGVGLAWRCGAAAPPPRETNGRRLRKDNIPAKVEIYLQLTRINCRFAGHPSIN
jgi:hypothetical protein